jgi:tRNA (uracil-5-)-methyltransferase TRM9
VSAWAVEQGRFRGIGERPTTDVDVPWRRADGTAVSRFYHLFRRGELESLMTAAGLTVLRAWREGDNHAVLASRPGVER